jgi:hypothetical protein
MPKTGDPFIDYLLIIAGFLPLLPVIFIFLKKAYLREQLNFLMIVCLLNFMQGMLLRFAHLGTENQHIIINIFPLPELVLLALLFQPPPGKKIKDLLTILLVAFLSVTVTYFSLKGWGTPGRQFEMIESTAIIAVILLRMPSLILASNLDIFQSPLFWIAGGSLFYFLINVLLAAVDSPKDDGQLLFMTTAGAIRYLLYLVAVLVAKNDALLTE